jgi:hypothetical protein
VPTSVVTTSRAASLRAALLLGAALAAAVLTWRLRPTGYGTDPVGEIVRGCAWLAWLVAGWLTLSVAVSAAGHLMRRRSDGSRHAFGAVDRCVPLRVSRLVDAVVTVGMVAALLGGVALPASASASRPAASPSSHLPAGGDPLDWPGLTDRAPASPLDRAPSDHRHHRAAQAGLVTGSPHRAGGIDGTVIVHAGDSLWSIAAAHLGADPTAAQIAAAWPRWYAENRAVVGTDPTLIRPGQRLRPPGPHGTEHALHRHAGSS